MIRLPSLFRPYDAYVSCDPAIKQGPSDLPAGATDEEIKAHEIAVREYIATLVACNDTGKWEPLLVPGEVPLKFVLQHIDRNHFRSLIDRAQLPESNVRCIGDRMIRALLVRLALVDIVGAEGVKVRREPDAQWDGWTMAQPEIIQILDSADPRIVNELGIMIQRRVTLGPKS